MNYTTTDTALAAYLIASGYPLSGIDYSGPRYEFLFDTSNQIRADADAYLTGQALVNPSAYSRINKKLMRIIRRQIQWEDD